jgi:hypothetical protein
MHTALIHAPVPVRRAAYATLATGLLALVVVALVRDWGPWWQVAAFGAAPDLALLLGVGAMAQGRLHPRAVPAYNLLHRLWGPVLLAPFLPVAALAWGFHVVLDRAVGYGLRTPDGFQRT